VEVARAGVVWEVAATEEVVLAAAAMAQVAE